MSAFNALIFPAFDAALFEQTILSCGISEYILASLNAAGANVFCAGSFCGLKEESLAGFFPDAENIGGFFTGDAPMALILFAPVPTITAGDILGLIKAAEGGPVSLKSGKVTIAVAGRPDILQELDLSELKSLTALDGGDIPVVTSAQKRFEAQEIIKDRINHGHLQNGVFIQSPATTFISPEAVIEEGAAILPGTMIYGQSSVAKGCVIGPNTLLEDAVIGESVTINSSQVLQSRVGRGATVGPFAYIRPNCNIGEGARIGDFVELKNSNIGEGTKVSHLTYIGDSDFGSRINVGCGVVTVNYDGKNKHRTTVADSSFIGCNVNLVAPVKVGRGAYVAAGSTIVDDVKADSLVIARARAVEKPDWAEKRRQDGKLKNDF